MKLESKKCAISEGKRLGIHDTSKKLCLIIGSSSNFLEDYNNFKNDNLDIHFDTITINKSILYIKKVDHWISCHPGDICKFNINQTRLDKGWNNEYKTHSLDRYVRAERMQNFIDYSWRLSGRMNGSSSLVAVYFAMGMDYNGVITCGIELTEKYLKYRDAWILFDSIYPNFIRSQSGFLETWLGRPIKDWIEGKLL